MELKLSRVWTVFLRYFYAHRNTPSSAFDFLYWPLVDMVLFGFIGVWLSKQQSSDKVVLSLVIGLVLWGIAYRTNLEISKNLVQELWDENLINFFATPLSLTEWICGLMLSGFLCIMFALPYGALLAYFIFGLNIFSIGFTIIPLIFLLIMSGWILGFIAAGILIYGGQKIETIVWAMGWLPAPFCSVYYPVEVLPNWMQFISKLLPMTYAFEGMRQALNTGTIPYYYLMVSFMLSFIYLIGTLIFFTFMFRKSKEQGLSNT
jgi:ABC-2 type transport system permease protein